MALSIRNPKAEKLARELAAESGETITQAITHALEERLERVRGRSTTPDLVEEILKISNCCFSGNYCRGCTGAVEFPEMGQILSLIPQIERESIAHLGFCFLRSL